MIILKVKNILSNTISQIIWKVVQEEKLYQKNIKHSEIFTKQLKIMVNININIDAKNAKSNKINIIKINKIIRIRDIKIKIKIMNTRIMNKILMNINNKEFLKKDKVLLLLLIFQPFLQDKLQTDHIKVNKIINSIN